MTWALLVPRKRTEYLWIAKRAARFIDQLRHSRVTLRCNNEPAIEALTRKIGQARQEGSQHRACSGTRGRPGQNTKGYAGTLHRGQSPAPRKDTVLVGGICCNQMNKCDIGSDGKRPLQRLHGRKDNTSILEFGETILHMPAKPARGGKWEPRVHPRVFVGTLNSSSEAVVVTEIKTRAANVRRILESERLHADRLLGMRAIPWSPDGSDNAFYIQVEMERPAEMVPRSPGEVLMESKVARTYLRGCPGCWYLTTGHGRQQTLSEA